MSVTVKLKKVIILRCQLLICAKILFPKTARMIFWDSMVSGVYEYNRKCDQCQQEGDIEATKVELKSILVPPAAIKQVNVDQCSLPEVNGYRYLTVFIDYVTKSSKFCNLIGVEQKITSVNELLEEQINTIYSALIKALG